MIRVVFSPEIIDTLDYERYHIRAQRFNGRWKLCI